MHSQALIWTEQANFCPSTNLGLVQVNSGAVQLHMGIQMDRRLLQKHCKYNQNKHGSLALAGEAACGLLPNIGEKFYNS